MKYIINIFENSYKDNWTEGEIRDTFTSICISHEMTENLAAALKSFRDSYAFDGKVWLDDNFFHSDSTMKSGHDGWETPTEADIEAWKKGDIDLYNVEYEMRVERVETPEKDELLKEIGDQVAIEE